MLALPVRVNLAAPAPPVTYAALAPAVTSAVHVRRLTFAELVPTATTTSLSTPMIVDGSPPVRRRAAAGVPSICLLPSTEIRTRARSDSLAILVVTFFPDTCSFVAVERPPGPLLGFRCHTLNPFPQSSGHTEGIASLTAPHSVSLWLLVRLLLICGLATLTPCTVFAALSQCLDPVGSRQQSRQDQSDA